MNMHALNISIAPTALSLDSFVIRPLTSDDTDAYRAVRERIMDIGDARYHSASYRRDRTLDTEDKMRNWCTADHEHCVMGIFLDGELVGIMTAVAHVPKESLIVEWDSVWLESRFRQLGIAKLAYQKLEEWSKANGFKFVETFVRADNHRVLGIRKKRGSLHTHTKYGEVWADGSVADAYFFLTNLFPANEQASTPEDRALSHLQSTLEELTDVMPSQDQKLA